MAQHGENARGFARVVGRAAGSGWRLLGSAAFFAALAGASLAAGGPERRDPQGLSFQGAYSFSALESEVAGIHPHPTRDDLFLVVVNRRPVYARGERAVLDERYRGHLLVVERHRGAVTRAIDLGGANYGGMAYGGRLLYVSSLDPPEILSVDIDAGRVVGRIAVSGPAGGLEYDQARSVLLAQMYVSQPHLAVLDPASARTLRTLWSDENAMDLALVSSDLLCTWVSSFDEHARGELRRLDPETGRVTGRLPLDRVHTSMAPLDRRVAGVEGFISLVRLDDAGTVGVFRYAYDRSRAAW
jgi:hypothetical protein